MTASPSRKGPAPSARACFSIFLRALTLAGEFPPAYALARGATSPWCTPWACDQIPAYLMIRLQHASHPRQRLRNKISVQSNIQD